MQEWWQFKTGNGVNCGKVTSSVYISVQWKACNEYRKKWVKEGNDAQHMTSVLSQWWPFVQIGIVSRNKDVLKIQVLAYTSLPRFWSPDVPWPSSLGMTNGQYTSHSRFRYRDPPWPISLRTVHGSQTSLWPRYAAGELRHLAVTWVYQRPLVVIAKLVLSTTAISPPTDPDTVPKLHF